MKLWFAIPGDLETRTGGYGYDRAVIAALRGQGHAVEIVPLAGDFPFPSAASLDQAQRALAAVPDGGRVLIDAMAYSAMPAVVARHAARLRLVALVHHPLCLETGLTEDEAARLEAWEAAALPQARRIIVTGHETAREVACRFAIPAERIAVVLPGCDTGNRPRATMDAAVPRIVSVGTLNPRKGYDVLIAAFAMIADLPWTARIIGGDTAFPELAMELKAEVARSGLAERVCFEGQIVSTEDELARSTVFALASRYEGYGMAFAEAMAHGLPIIGCRAGAVPDVVPPEAGILVPPDDAEAFAAALREVLADPARRRALAEGSWQAGRRLPTWEDAGRQIVEVFASAAELPPIAAAR